MSTSTYETVSLKRSADQVEQGDMSLSPLCINPMKFLETPTKDYGYGYDENSLTSMMSTRRSSLHLIHKKFADEIEERRKVNFATTEKSDPVDDEPPQKRRRFQRRNSKTAAMLFSSMASIVASDFEEEEDKKEEPSHSSDDSAWDGGLEIAEELVRQLKLRRQSCGSSSTA
jgi:hypothetical protein